MSYVYIASPFFNDDQLNIVKIIEKQLSDAEINYYSPRSEGVIKDMTEQEKINRVDYIYNQNVDNIESCRWVLCVIDDYDTGTIFEMGYAASANKDIVTLSTHGHGLNLMLARCTFAHVNTIADAVACIMGYAFDGELKKVIT